MLIFPNRSADIERNAQKTTIPRRKQGLLEQEQEFAWGQFEHTCAMPKALVRFKDYPFSSLLLQVSSASIVPSVSVNPSLSVMPSVSAMPSASTVPSVGANPSGRTFLAVFSHFHLSILTIVHKTVGWLRIDSYKQPSTFPKRRVPRVGWGAIVGAFSDDSSLQENRARLRALLIRWHPDHFLQCFGTKLFPGNVPSIQSKLNATIRYLS